MDRRFFLALMVALLFMFVYTNMIAPPPKRPAPEPSGAAAPSPESGPETLPAPPERTAAPPAAGPSAYPRTEIEVGEDLRVETDLYVAVLSNRGACIKELYARNYYRRVLSEEEAAGAGTDEWLPYCMEGDPAVPTLGLALNAGDGTPLTLAAWEADVRPAEGGTDVVFRYQDGRGVGYEKTLRFRDGQSFVDVEIGIRNENPEVRALTYLFTAAGYMPDFAQASFQKPPSAVVAYGDEPEFIDVAGKSLEDDSRHVEIPRGERLQFYGDHNNYFAAVLWPDDRTAPLLKRVHLEEVPDTVRVQAERGRIEEDAGSNARATALLDVALPVGQTQTLGFRFFAGPKSSALMRDDQYAVFRPLYEHDYGSLAFINKALLWTLQGFHTLSRNWGVAIILLTVLVKALLFPMNRLQSRTMEGFQKKMAVLKPQLDELKKKYKNNVRKFHEEQQKLMREHAVRPPVFGCLIVFLQFPVFIGLFQILRTSFELRQQPFCLWISDLSQPDALPLPFSFPLPFLGSISSINVLPILMLAAMVLQFRMMPKPSDPQQAQMQKMMMFMPFLFMVFLYNYASGLSLYMLTNALLGIAQTKFLKVSVAT